MRAGVRVRGGVRVYLRVIGGRVCTRVYVTLRCRVPRARVLVCALVPLNWRRVNVKYRRTRTRPYVPAARTHVHKI